MKKSRFIIGASAALILLSACSAQYRAHGYMPQQEEVDGLVVGVDNRDSVAKSLGVPSSGGVARDNAYFYVRSRIQQGALGRPTEVDREVLVLSFNKQGVLSNIERFGLQDGTVVSLEHRVTKTAGPELSLIRQIIGSVGGSAPNL
ncbi:outer membrane protein assembly factor BamE [Rhodobacteraceae bacterium nBUS_24]|jgi:outer membrane protein assembly factor BamE (lipoprotein component of BamABCDE complex)|nr:outer membrane protein assembly factor BamE [Marinovum sp.]MBT4873328.1 outer membrane protein assembly factor BamE [Marinovum sp.]MBT6532862.1 outer membrane protein assembly factor BamE [Marinovum sp.]MBT7907677.1 outer membrane protein assembly factor BamE [Marinovum sp.]